MRLKSTKLILSSLALSVCLVGCHPRAVLIPSGEPVRLAEDVKVHVYVEGDDGRRVKSQNQVTLHQGWWALPDPAEDSQKDTPE
jgi:hypothetical protein